MDRRGWTTGVLVVVAVSAAAVVPFRREAVPVTFASPRADQDDHPRPANGTEWREDAWRRADVWRPVDPSRADLSANPADPGGLLSASVVRCRFQSRPPHGTSPKFDCLLPDGEVVKVKYGFSNEGRAELAASRLLTALGFGADRMYLVPRLRCYGCPQFPFQTMWALEQLSLREFVSRWLPDTRYADFEWVAVERHFEGTTIATADDEGWAWFELDRIDPANGASRAEIDALRLIAMLLVHWDNKRANQRLACVSPLDAETLHCARPFAIIHDLGATFGPKRTNLSQWAAVPVWTDATRCRVSMRQLPYGGGTFPATEISEAGRKLLLNELAMLEQRQLLELFAGARFPQPQRWAQAFQDKVRQIAAAGPCPSQPSTGIR